MRQASLIPFLAQKYGFLLPNPNGTITASFKQAIKGEISIDCVYYEWSTEQTDVEFKVSAGVNILATYHVKSSTGRDDGSSSRDEYDIVVSENELRTLDVYYDDGYGNYENTHSTLTNFVVKVNGQEIYNASVSPENGKIYNGYRIKYTYKYI